MFQQALSCGTFLGCNSHQRMPEEYMDAEQSPGLSSSRLNDGHPASSNGAQGNSLHNSDLEEDGPEPTPGLDISPGEERLDYRPPASSNGAQGDSLLNGDLQENGYMFSDNGHGVNSRPGFVPHEPIDTSSDSVSTIYGRVFPPSRPRQVASNAAEYYKSEANRLTTFIDWQHQAVVRKEDLARNGFIYTGTSDKVRCHYCNGILRSWERGDIVETEHSRNFPQCLFVCGENVGNMPLNLSTNGHHPSNNVAARNAGSRTQVRRDEGHDISPLEDRCGSQPSPLSASHNTTVHDAVSDPQQGSYSSPRNKGMAVEPTRLATFEAWPAQMKQKPKDLAQAGLYYTGDGDKTKCFYCDGLLYNWDPEDDPFVEHARWFPNCQYIQLVKGETFVENVQKGGATHDVLLEKPAVLAVLGMRECGWDVDLVKQAVASIREREGANTDFTASELMTEVMRIEVSSTSRSGASVNGQRDPEDMQKLRLENESLRDRQMCKICMERDVEIVFHPCNHFVCCASCSTAISECPICRKTIQSLNKVFMA